MKRNEKCRRLSDAVGWRISQSEEARVALEAKMEQERRQAQARMEEEVRNRKEEERVRRQIKELALWSAAEETVMDQKRHDEARLEGGIQGGTFFNAVDWYTKDVEASWARATGSRVPAETRQAKEARSRAEERKKAEEERKHAQEEEEHRNEVGGDLSKAMKKDEYEAALESNRRKAFVRDEVDWGIKMSEKQREQRRIAEEALEKARKIEEARKQEEEKERKLVDEKRRREEKEEKEEQARERVMEMLEQQQRYEANVNDGMLRGHLADEVNWRIERSEAARDESQRQEQLLEVTPSVRRMKQKREDSERRKREREQEEEQKQEAGAVRLEEDARDEAEFQQEMKWVMEARVLERTETWASELGIITEGGDNEDSDDVNAPARQVEEVNEQREKRNY
ncbi:hypothetical protein BJ165DRAFT_1408084 [Panaeolus papilionaceus]|nr:hypothetical protein BJ165DRAFT_1408084 [Panaeolus papilionaceus]